jgi:hypothetical protein
MNQRAFIGEMMPLVKGKEAKTHKGFSKNVKVEMTEANKPQKQAVAIAYSLARKSDKKSNKKKLGKSK